MIMNAYIINMESDIKRRNYVTSILSNYPSIKAEFISAVDGRALDKSQVLALFDLNTFLQHYNRIALPGEIGCTLSHQKIYHKMYDEKLESALIFEDDIVIKEDISPMILQIQKELNTDEPKIILLSGWYWYSKKKTFDSTHQLASVVDGYLTHSYAINLAAVKLMMSKRPFLLADAWEEYIKKGVKIFGITPHLIDQDWSNFKSTISNNKRGIGYNNIIHWIKIKRRTIIQRVLKYIGHFEKKSI